MPEQTTSKVFKSLVYNRLLNYVETCGILTENQYGPRKNHSTSIALLQLYDKISSAVDKNEFTIGIFLDLCKAFGTVNRDILLKKFQHYGIRGIALDLFKSYLSITQQYVQYNGVCPQKMTVECGVPQGSILGPLLFYYMLNNTCNVSKILQFVLFADDTNLFYTHKNLQCLTQQVNKELNRLSYWFSSNKSSINLEKTYFIIF